MDNLFEQEYIDVDDLFKIVGYERTAIVLLRNTISRNSNRDLSSYITRKHPHLNLSLELTKHNTERMECVLVDQDPKTTVDIVSLFVRLYDNDHNTESIIGEEVINKLNSIIDKFGYDTLYVETDLTFDYKWLEEVKIKKVRLLGSK